MRGDLLACCVLALALTGCASDQPLNRQTESGKAEAVLPNITVDAFRNEAILRCAQHGGEMESGQNSVICSREETGGRGIAAQLLVGNAYSGTPHTKLRLTFAQQGTGLYVVADEWLEITMGFGEVKKIPLTSNALRNSLQTDLDTIAERLRLQQSQH